MTDAPRGLAAAHRALDALLGRFLAAAEARADGPACEAIAAFDAELRRHTAREEESLIPEPAGPRLVPSHTESDAERLGRELRLEHAQIGELSGLMFRLAEAGDVAGARRHFPNLARRWDAHTEKEERAFPDAEGSTLKS